MIGEVSKTEFSRLNGWGKPYTTKLGKNDRLVMTPKGFVDYEASMQRIAATADPNRDDVAARHASARAAVAAPAPSASPIYAPARPDAAPTAGETVGSGYQAARAVKERYLALEAKRAYEVACGDLMRAADVVAVVSAAATTLRTRLEALPPTLAQQLAAPMGETERRILIADAIESALSGLAAEFARLAKDTTH